MFLIKNKNNSIGLFCHKRMETRLNPFIIPQPPLTYSYNYTEFLKQDNNDVIHRLVVVCGWLCVRLIGIGYKVGGGR